VELSYSVIFFISFYIVAVVLVYIYLAIFAHDT